MLFTALIVSLGYLWSSSVFIPEWTKEENGVHGYSKDEIAEFLSN